MSGNPMSVFPSNSIEDLAMFYVKNVVFPRMDESSKTPEALMAAYLHAYRDFKEAYRHLRKQPQPERW